MKRKGLTPETQAMYDRLENDYEHRMEMVDCRINLANSLAGFKKWMRYKETVIQHNRLGEYEDTFSIGIHGEIKKY